MADNNEFEYTKVTLEDKIQEITKMINSTKDFDTWGVEKTKILSSLIEYLKEFNKNLFAQTNKKSDKGIKFSDRIIEKIYILNGNIGNIITDLNQIKDSKNLDNDTYIKSIDQEVDDEDPLNIKYTKKLIVKIMKGVQDLKNECHKEAYASSFTMLLDSVFNSLKSIIRVFFVKEKQLTQDINKSKFTRNQAKNALLLRDIQPKDEKRLAKDKKKSKSKKPRNDLNTF